MNSSAPLIDPNALIFMPDCMVCMFFVLYGNQPKIWCINFFLNRRVDCSNGDCGHVSVGCLNAWSWQKSCSNISLALLPAAYAILIKGVLSIATDLPRPSESPFALGGLGCLLFIALILWIACDVGAFIDTPSIIYIGLSITTVIAIALRGHQPLLATLYRHLSGI